MTDKKQKIIIITTCIVGIIVISIGSILFYNLGSKSNNIAEFQTYLNEYQGSSQKCILGKNESAYTELINESLSAISKKDANKTVQLKVKLKKLQEKIVAENKKTAKLAEETAENRKLTLEDARELIFKEDNYFASKEVNSGSKLDGDDPHNTKLLNYKVNEGVFSFTFRDPSMVENDGLTSFYYVGKDSRNVYRCSSVGGAGGDLYLIENNKTVKTLKYINNTVDQNKVTSLGQLSSSEALKKVQQSYPDYIYIDGGSINEVLNDAKGVDEPAYTFRFTNDGKMDIYVAWVFADGGIKFRLVGNKDQQH